MANRLLDEPDVQPPKTNAAVDDYLAILAKDLPGPSGPRAAALGEVRDGLNEAIACQVGRGVPTLFATRVALAELGSPTVVAEAFAPELATTQARRTLFAFLVTGPLVGVWWLLLLPTHMLATRPRILWTAIPALPLLGLAVAAAVAILATTGSLIRWLPESTPRRALLAASGVGLGAVMVDLSVLATFAMRILGTSWQPNVAIAAVALAGSLIRISCATRSVLRSRATLTHLQPIGAPLTQGLTATSLPRDRARAPWPKHDHTA
jgi:hypothetical protein